jgi:hypothetical protein
MRKAVFLIALLLASSALIADESAKFVGKWSWTAVGATKSQTRIFTQDGYIKDVIVTQNALGTTTNIDTKIIQYFVNLDVDLLAIRTGTVMYVYQYKFETLNRLILTDVTVPDNPKIVCVRTTN